MTVALQIGETDHYGFQHPDNGAEMVLMLDMEDNPVVEVADWVLDEASDEEVGRLKAMAMALTKAVHHMTDLYEAACKLSRAPYCCEDILR